MTTAEMEMVLKKMPVERRILLIEDAWDSIRAESDKLPVPVSHKRELNRRFKKYAKAPSALLSLLELKKAVQSRI